MGDCHCSNIAIMQLFHELKQQFPALPDHVVSQCIAQNSHDKETCARSLRATQESRPPSGAFPPPPPPDTLTPINVITMNHSNHINQMNHINHSNHSNHHHVGPRPHRPASLDIGVAHTCPRTINGAPASAPAACPSRGFFDDLTNPNAGFELNVNVACSPAGNRDFRTIPVVGTCKRSALLVEPRPHYVGHVPDDGRLTNGCSLADNSRSYTSVSLTLRPPSSEPQPPINIQSHGSSLTYSTSSVDSRGFQSRLQISIGPGTLGSVAAARIRPPMGPTRPSTLLPPAMTPHRPPGLPAGPPSQLPRPTTTVSAPTTPSVPTNVGLPPSNSLPTTPASPTPSNFSTNLVNHGSSILTNTTNADFSQSPINKVADHQKQLVAEQMVRRNRLAKELRAEKGKLDAMKRELQCLARPFNATIPPQDLERKLRSEIYQLQVECDRMASEVDQTSDPAVPLGETNEEFYQSIYTGQPFTPFTANPVVPPPLPSRPPAWAPVGDGEERDGPSWVCRMCTFDNHPLMDKCEQCDMPRLPSHNAGMVNPKCLVPVDRMRPLFKSNSDPKHDDQSLKTAPRPQDR